MAFGLRSLSTSFVKTAQLRVLLKTLGWPISLCVIDPPPTTHAGQPADVDNVRSLIARSHGSEVSSTRVPFHGRRTDAPLPGRVAHGHQDDHGAEKMLRPCCKHLLCCEWSCSTPVICSKTKVLEYNFVCGTDGLGTLCLFRSKISLG